MSAPEQISLPDGAGGWMTVTVARPDKNGGWATVVGGTAAPPAKFTPDDGPVRNIATNAGVLQNQWNPGATGGATATRHMLHANADSITLGYFARPNPKFGATTSTPLRVWVRPRGGTWKAATFNGQPEVALTVAATSEETLLPEHAQNVYTDPIPGPWRLGDEIEVLTWGQSPGGTMGVQGVLDGAYDLGMTTGPPSTVATAPNSAFSASARGTRPSTILAPSAQKSSWALIGDSNSVNADRSYMAQAFRARNLAHILNGKHGLGTYHLNDGWWDFQLGEQAKYADSVFSALGTNDGNKVGADVREQMVAAWNRAKRAGITRWVQATVAPRALDNGDGTTSGIMGTGVTLNPWLRDGAPIVNGAAAPAGTTDPAAIRATVIRADGTKISGSTAHPMGEGWVCDTASALESSVGSNTYRKDRPQPVYDPRDLTHYSQAGHDVQAPILARDLGIMGF